MPACVDDAYRAAVRGLKPCLSSGRFRFASDRRCRPETALVATTYSKCIIYNSKARARVFRSALYLFMSSIEGFHFFDCSVQVSLLFTH